MNCPKCGASVADGSAFCEVCGAPLAAAPAATPVEAATAAAASVAAAAAATDQTVPGATQYVSPHAQQASPYAKNGPSTYYSSAGQGGPSTHYSSQQDYNQGKAPGYTAQQQSYQQQSYQQQQQQYQQAAATQKTYAYTTGTSRALAMSVYWGLFPLIFAWAVADKDTDPFIRHHLNQGLVIFIGGIISAILAFVIIGGIIAIYLFVMMIMGTIQAYHGEVTELPLVGKIKILK